MSDSVRFLVVGLEHCDSIAIGSTIKRLLSAGKRAPLELRREPDNKFDPNAIRILFDGKPFGYVPNSEDHKMADALAPAIDAGLAKVSAEAVRCVWNSNRMVYRCEAVLRLIDV